MEFEALHPEFGARVAGIDLSGEISCSDVNTILDGMNQYSLLVFPGKKLDDKIHLAFTRLFGVPEEEHVSYYSRGEILYIGTIGNIDSNGNHMKNDNRRVRSQTGNEMWHSDSSFREIPSLFSISHAYEVPPEGGETEFASTRTAYDRLDAKTRSEIGELAGIHDYIYSRTKVSDDAVTEEQRTYMYPVRQRLVRENPVTGRKNLYIGSHVRDIVGWPRTRSRALLDSLLEDTIRPESVYQHQWAVGDLVMWDNRCLLHRGCGYDADRFRRRMRQTRVRGTCPTLAESFQGSKEPLDKS